MSGCKHEFNKSGFCEWTSNDGKIKHYIVKECKKCNEIIEEKKK
jgi:hypothetical protein